METTEVNTRRNFLLAASLGGVGAVAMIAGPHVRFDAAPAAKAVAREPTGYRVTAHVMKYYRTAEV
jgi:hypothetical protein